MRMIPMRMILRAVITQDGYLPAVKHLQLHHPILFAGLGESFVRKMYQPGSLKKLKETAVEKLDRGCGNVGSTGRKYGLAPLAPLSLAPLPIAPLPKKRARKREINVFLPFG
jgi:hypothetical protein